MMSGYELLFLFLLLSWGIVVRVQHCLDGEERLTSGMVNASKARLNPDNHNMIQNAHLHPLATTAYPEMTGASAGPEAAARP